ncbi:MAG: hypothetical protein IPJ87_13015 [Flavobacteriales bacterium]|nr:hypothetical protein [Flavobacteriales bacterium]MBK7942772.1 hypothetical protein [Flavobacteriales bacterium]MBK9698828.1 hypothetical protein [Flavobacteriales bacterium]
MTQPFNSADAQQNGILDGDMVCVESPRGKVDIKARITDEVKPAGRQAGPASSAAPSTSRRSCSTSSPAQPCVASQFIGFAAV